MGLQPHAVHAPAGLGLEEGTRPEIVEFGTKNLAGVNVRQVQRGVLSKRYGFTYLPVLRADATSSTTGHKMFMDGNTPVRITDLLEAEVYSPGAATWKAVGRVPEATYSLSDLPVAGTAGSVEDVEYCNGFVAVINREKVAYSYVTVTDAVTGAVVLPPASAFGVGDVPSLLASFSGRYIVAVVGNGSPLIEAYIFDTLAPAAGFAVLAIVATDYNGPAPLDIVGLEDRVAIAYANTSVGTERVSVKTYDATGLLESRTITTAAANPSAVSIAGSNADTLWVAWSEVLNVRLIGLQGNTLATVLASTATVFATAATTPGLIGISPTTGGAGRLISMSGGTASLRTVMRDWTTVAGAVTPGAAATTLNNATFCGKPRFYGGRHYALFFASSTTVTGTVSTSHATANEQHNLVLCDFTDNVAWVRPVVNIAPGLAVNSYQGKAKLSVGAATSTFYTVCDITKSSSINAAALVAIDFAPAVRWQTASHGNSVIISGGVVSYFDGNRVAEVGFIQRPPTPTSSVAGTGITGSNYRHIAVYEEVDADGNWCVSGISSPTTALSAANQTISVSARPLTISARLGRAAYVYAPQSVRIAIYRTLTGGTAPYYRVGSVANDPTATVSTFADNFADATIAANAKLYEQPGIPGTAQDRRTPPGLGLLVSYNGMLVGAIGSDVHYSGQNVYGEASWFNPIFQVPVPGEGAITALWVMDGTLYVAKKREVYAISGEAPSDNGSSGGLGLPRRLAVDVGAVSPHTAVTALGTFFQSERGIEILSRAQSVEWVGASMQETLELFTTVTSMTVDAAASVVLVELTNGTNGRTLVFDLAIKDWVSVDRRTSALAAVNARSVSACMIYTGTAWRYAWMSTTGYVQYEDRASFLDSGAWVTAQYETAWLKHGLQQEQRVWDGIILFEQHTAAGLTVEVAYDYAAYASADTKTWVEAETLGGRQLEFRPKNRGMAMKFRVSDVAPAVLGTAQGFTFVGMSFDMAAKQGPTKGTLRLDPSKRK